MFGAILLFLCLRLALLGPSLQAENEDCPGFNTGMKQEVRGCSNNSTMADMWSNTFKCI